LRARVSVAPADARGATADGAGPRRPSPVTADTLRRLDGHTRARVARELQRAFGNRTLQRQPSDPPAGVTTGADPLPAGLTTPGAAGVRSVDDPALPGGWTDPGGRTTSSSAVGAVDRILLEGLSGRQQHQGRLREQRVFGAGQNLADAVGSGPAASRGRAVALVPRATRTGGSGEIAVVLHLHGLGVGLRRRDPQPMDVGEYQFEQQLEAFAASRTGSRVIALLPVGTSVSLNDSGTGFRNTNFGAIDPDTFIGECFGQLSTILPAGATPGDVYLSAHSGGGLEVTRMIADRRLPSRFRGLFLFEAFHEGDTDAFARFATQRLEGELRALEAERARPGATDDEKFAAQAAMLRDGFRFVALGGFGGYRTRGSTIRAAILRWWATNRRRLHAATAGRTALLDALWANYQAQLFPDSTHHNALATARNNLGRALASLPQRGALAAVTPVPAPAAPPPAPAGTPSPVLSRTPARPPRTLARDGLDPAPPATTAAAVQRAGELLVDAAEMKALEHRINSAEVCLVEPADFTAGAIEITHLPAPYVRRTLEARAGQPELVAPFDAAVQRIVGQGHPAEWLMRRRAYAEVPELLRLLEQRFIRDPNASSLDLLAPDRARRYRVDTPWAHEDYPGGITGANEGRANQMAAELTRIRPERRANGGDDRVVDERDVALPRMREYIRDELRAVDGLPGFRLNRHAAAAFAAMRAAAAADLEAGGGQGVALEPAGGAGSFYRTPAASAAAAAASGNNAAVANFSSHNLGLAVDLRMSFPGHPFAEATTRPMRNVVDMRQSPAHKWMFVRGARWGFYPYQNEPWHWEYNPPGFRDVFLAEYRAWLAAQAQPAAP
jgi:hypothetical protein